MRRSACLGTGAGVKAAWAAAALSALAAAGFIAAHHSLWPAAASLALAAWFVLEYRRPSLWLFVLPAGVPALNFSPWTGWIVFEEFDVLVLGGVAAGYARFARHATDDRRRCIDGAKPQRFLSQRSHFLVFGVESPTPVIGLQAGFRATPTRSIACASAKACSTPCCCCPSPDASSM